MALLLTPRLDLIVWSILSLLLCSLCVQTANAQFGTMNIFVASDYSVTPFTWGSNYFNNYNATWIFTTNQGYRLQITFDYINTESAFDFVAVGNGDIVGKQELLVWSGGPVSDQLKVISSGNMLWLSFTTDQSIVSDGFNAGVQVIQTDLDCGGTFECSNGVCLHESAICDEKNNCANGADETSTLCAGLCSSLQFKCSNSTCIPWSAVCDDVQDCPANEDEAYCPACGRRNYQSESIRIVGGEAAVPGAWPWQASIFSGPSHYCGGTLLNSRWILSAAHCYVGRDDKIILGNHRVAALDPTQRGYTVEEVINHPSYDFFSKLNDISLIRLTTDVAFDDYISPACLPSQDWPADTDTWITGWGDQEASYDDQLQEVTVPIIDTETCNRPSWYDGRVYDCCMFCAGLAEGGKDSCQGDSGGPVVVNNSGTGTFEVIGITSFGYGCAEPNKPGVYTKVHYYLSWINSIIS